MIEFNTPVGELPGIALAYQKKLKKLGIKTVKDLLFYFPSRYEDFSNIAPIQEARPGNHVCVQGEIISIENTKSFRKWMDITEAVIQDDSGSIRALWFNQPYLSKSLKEGDFVCLAGKVSIGKDGIYFNGPAYEKISARQANDELTHTGRIVPVYGETKGLTSRWLRYILKPLLVRFHEQLPEIIPPHILRAHKLLPINEAIWQVHFPDSFEAADAAKARFAFEDMFLLQLAVLREKFQLQQKRSPACPMQIELMQQFTRSLPFTLTDSQRTCLFTILKDMEKAVPMSRLLEGDVGSGKTVVATGAALNAVACGYQVAFMAPTEILAKQHFQSIAQILEPLNISIGLMTAKEAHLAHGTERAELTKSNLLQEIKKGAVSLVVGTHALLQKTVAFKSLALVILDEQHRFGVDQRSKLTKAGKLVPHLLSMTATPIPRTLALTMYGDLDISLIKEMPSNRKKVKTIIVDPQQRPEAYDFIAAEVKRGRGVFVICPKIESTEGKLERLQEKGAVSGSFAPQNYAPELFGLPEIKSVEQEYEKLSKEIFPEFRVTILHGKMRPPEKERVMRDFQRGEIDILVSTSVVEVGVDVPRATVMMIEGAERFGLAQLHQFRGRVGRSDLQSYCFLFTTSPDQLNRKRLKALVESSNGFELAQKDLEIRGPGQLYGKQQWGMPDLAMEGLGNIFLVEKARQAAKDLLEQDPGLKNHPPLREQVEKFRAKIHFE